MSITVKTAKVGSKVAVVNPGGNEGYFFNKGDTAILIQQDNDGDWLADFTGNSVYESPGQWFMSEFRFEVLEE